MFSPQKTTRKSDRDRYGKRNQVEALSFCRFSKDLVCVLFTALFKWIFTCKSFFQQCIVLYRAPYRHTYIVLDERPRLCTYLCEKDWQSDVVVFTVSTLCPRENKCGVWLLVLQLIVTWPVLFLQVEARNCAFWPISRLRKH